MGHFKGDLKTDAGLIHRLMKEEHNCRAAQELKELQELHSVLNLLLCNVLCCVLHKRVQIGGFPHRERRLPLIRGRELLATLVSRRRG